MRATDRKDLLVLVAMFGVVVLAGLWSVLQQPPAAPVIPEVAFSPQMWTLLNDILNQEHARQLRLYPYPSPYTMMDVDESALLGRKDDISRAASSKGDLSLVELLTSLRERKKDRDVNKAQELQKGDYRKAIEGLLEQNGLGPVTLLPRR
jgi:hypothetical protein